MKKLRTFTLAVLCIIIIGSVQKSFAQGFRFAEAWCIDWEKNLYELDPTSGNWHFRMADVVKIDGSYYRTGVGSEATFMINTSGEVYQHISGNWIRRYGMINAADIASYDINSTFVIEEGAKQIYTYKPNWQGFDWHSDAPTYPRCIDVDDQGRPWIVDGSGNVYLYTDNNWKMVHKRGFTMTNDPSEFRAYDIGANAGEVYVVGAYGPANITCLYRFNGTKFVQADFDLIQILKVDVNRDGTIFVTCQMSGHLLYKPVHSNQFIKDSAFIYNHIIEIGM